MAASTVKKVIAQRFDREALAGFVNPQTCFQPGGMELMRRDGSLHILEWAELKALAYVKDFEESGEFERRRFLTRPKMAGLWVRLRFRDGDECEGVLPNDLLTLEPWGFTFVPPEPFGNQQKVFAPKQALRGVEVLGVIGSPLTRRSKEKEKPARDQIGLFE